MEISFEEVVKYSQQFTMLYVEDNNDAREMTSLILEDFFAEIKVAKNGQEGVEVYKKGGIDIILTDINMPVMTGLEMIEEIRKEDKDIPILVLSAHNEDKYFLDAIRLGVNGFIIKPIDLDQLIGYIYQTTKQLSIAKEAQQNINLLKQYEKISNFSSIISKTDPKGIITFVNNKFCEISGFTKEELIGKNHNIVRHPDNPKSMFADMWHTIKDEKKIWHGIVRNQTKDKKSYYVDSVVMPIVDTNGEIIEYISMRNDITEIMNPLKQLTQNIKNAKNPLLVYMKLRNINDLVEFYENDIVEKIEEKVRDYLQERFGENFEIDRVFLLSNAEFAVILSQDDCNIPHDCIEKLKKLFKDFNNHMITFENIQYDIDMLMSIVYEGERVLESAKLGIKKLFKTKQQFMIANNFATLRREKAKENMQKVSVIRNAILNSRIVSYFQPIIDNKTKAIVKYESLVRLIDQDGKVLSPYFFLETAKKSNYYTQITNIVLEHSFNILKHCDKEISINLSAMDIEQQTTREKVYDLLEKNKAIANKVVFELLESEDVKNFDTVLEFIQIVKQYGTKIAIDDFGAGYSNYERLLSYQPDILKIDGCLIRDIETSSYSMSVVKSIVTFAKEQNLQTIAEFIENEAIFNIVRELGVDFSQGYYFGKPEPLIL